MGETCATMLDNYNKRNNRTCQQNVDPLVCVNRKCCNLRPPSASPASTPYLHVLPPPPPASSAPPPPEPMPAPLPLILPPPPSPPPPSALLDPMEVPVPFTAGSTTLSPAQFPLPGPPPPSSPPLQGQDVEPFHIASAAQYAIPVDPIDGATEDEIFHPSSRMPGDHRADPIELKDLEDPPPRWLPIAVLLALGAYFRRPLLLCFTRLRQLPETISMMMEPLPEQHEELHLLNPHSLDEEEEVLPEASQNSSPTVQRATNSPISCVSPAPAVRGVSEPARSDSLCLPMGSKRGAESAASEGTSGHCDGWDWSGDEEEQDAESGRWNSGWEEDTPWDDDRRQEQTRASGESPATAARSSSHSV